MARRGCCRCPRRATDDEAAIRATLRVLVDRFNTRDAVSLGGEVDYEYIYLPHGPCPTILICYNAAGREWFVRGSVSEMLWPPDAAQEDTYAFDLLNKEGAHEARVEEHSIRIQQGNVLSLLWWKDEDMLIKIEDFEGARAARRSDGRLEE